jgi:hypothetical protein
MGSIFARAFSHMGRHKLPYIGGGAAAVLGGAYLYSKSGQPQPGQESSGLPAYSTTGTNGYDQFSSGGSTIPGMGSSTTPGF